MRKKYLSALPATIFKIIVFALMALYALSLLAPLVWGMLSALKEPLEYYDSFKLPQKWLFVNFIKAVEAMSAEEIGFLEMAWNSIWFSGGSTVITVYMTAITAYVMSKFEFRSRKLLYSLSVVIMVVPLYGAFPAMYKFYYTSGLVNSYAILLSSFNGLVGANFILMHGYFKNVSKTYMEAAVVDGASPIKIYNSVMMPIAWPMILVIFLNTFIGNWNNYLSPMLYLPNKLTLAAGLFKYQEVVERMSNYPIYYAAAFIFILPVLVIFAFLCNTMMENMTFGALKE